MSPDALPLIPGLIAAVILWVWALSPLWRKSG